MKRPEETEAVEVTPYYRGLSGSEVARALLTRFLPGSVLGLGGGLVLLGLAPGDWVAAGTLIAAGAVTMTAGFAAGLEALRRWLYPDAEITGRRSFVAGTLAPLATFTVAALMGTGFRVPTMLGLLFVVAFVLALTMFFAWLTPTPEGLLEGAYKQPTLLFLSEPEEGPDGAGRPH